MGHAQVETADPGRPYAQVAMNISALLRALSLDAGSLRVSEIAYHADVWQPHHAHEQTTVTLVLGGALRESVGRHEEVARALSVVVKPGGTEHADRFGSRGARTLQIGLETGFAAALSDWDSRLGHWRWHHGGAAVPAFLRLLSVFRRQGSGAREVEDRVYDVLAVLSQPRDRAERKSPPQWLELVRDELDAAGRVAVRDLARSAGVHPVYLARQFRRFFGCSITEHARRRRVQVAAQQLSGSKTPLSVVSYTSGFADQSHMCRVFKSDTGLTPSVFRQLTK
jgi:AraC family transcriptional regulator